LIAAGIAATATPVTDPQILIDTGGDPLNLSTSLGQAQPCSPGPCTFDFLNDTGQLVTNFTFDTFISKGLSQTQIDSNFSCVDPSGFFTDNGNGCTIHYDSISGELKYLFVAQLPPDDDETTDPETGEHEGLPPNGTFHITFTGWQEDLTVDNVKLYDGTPGTTNTFETSAVPEPAAAGSMVAGLVMLAAVWRRRRARQ
jgi:hypothetical protein